MVMTRGCPDLLPIAVTKNMTLVKKLGEESCSFFLYVTVHHQGSQAGTQVGQEPGFRN